MLENQEINLHLFRKEQLFMTRDGKEQVIFQDKTGKRFAIWLSEDQRNTKEILGNFKISLPESARNPGAFDQKQYLKNYNCHALADITTSQQDVILKSSKLFKIDKFNLYHQFKLWLENYFDTDSSGFILSFAFGQRQYLSKQLTNDFQNLGLRHLLAVSGFHFDLFLLPFAKVLSLKKKKPMQGLILFLPLIYFYNWLCNFPVGLIRASLINILHTLAIFFEQEISRKNILLLLLSFWLVIKPFSILQIGFQLSFLASFIIYFTLPYLKKLTLLNKSKILLTMSLSFFIQISILPLLLKHFGSWQIATIIFNSILVFPLSLLFILSLFLVFQFFWQSLFTFTLLDFLIDFFAWLVEGFLQIFSVLASSSLWTLFKKTPFDFLTGLALGLIAIFFSYKILRFLMIILTRRSTIGLDLKSLLLSFLALILLLNTLVKPRESWQVYFLDVGQGDSCLIISPDRKSVLIDGGLPGKGHQIILPAMEHLGLAKINQAVISHFDQDHCGGIIDLLEIDKVEEVIVPQMLNSDLFLSASQEIEAGVEYLCSSKDIPLIRLQKNDLLNLDSIDLQTKILAPDLENCYQVQDDNAYSLCFALEIENFAILFTGDLTRETEEDLIIKQIIPDVDLLKVAHHGSKFSTFENFIEQAQPEYAVISVGNNSYGHPSLEVLQRLDQYNVMVRRTDINGAIMLELKNRQWILTSYLE